MALHIKDVVMIEDTVNKQQLGHYDNDDVFFSACLESIALRSRSFKRYIFFQARKSPYFRYLIYIIK